MAIHAATDEAHHRTHVLPPPSIVCIPTRMANREGKVTPTTLAPARQRSALDTVAVLAVLGRAPWRPRRTLPDRRALYRSAGVEPSHVPSEEATLADVQADGRITRRDVMTLGHLNEKQSEYQIKKLVEAGHLRVVGRGRNVHYVRP